MHSGVYISETRARAAKQASPRTAIVMGGHHVSFLDKVSLYYYPEIDVIVRGEGEETTVEVVDALINGKTFQGMKGITVRDDTNYPERHPDRSLIKNLDSLPPPPLDLLKNERRYVLPFSLSRGCPYSCSFCCDSAYWQHHYRGYSPKKLADYLLRITTEYPNIQLMCADSNLFLKKPTVREFAYALPQGFFRNHYLSALLRVNQLNHENLRLVNRLGFREIYVGCENADNRVLADMKKGTTYSQSVDGLKLFGRDEEPFVLSALWITGFPTEDQASKARNLAAIRDLLRQGVVADIDPNGFVPHPGTHVYDNPERYGMRIRHYRWRSYDYHQAPVFETNSMSQSEIWEYYLDAYRLILEYLLAERGLDGQGKTHFLNLSNRFASQLENDMGKHFKSKGMI